MKNRKRNEQQLLSYSVCFLCAVKSFISGAKSNWCCVVHMNICLINRECCKLFAHSDVQTTWVYTHSLTHLIDTIHTHTFLIECTHVVELDLYTILFHVTISRASKWVNVLREMIIKINLLTYKIIACNLF